MTKEFCRREFLNGPGFHSLAAIMIQFEYWDESNKSTDTFYPEFTISDCNRSIDLALDVDTVEGLENSINKLLTIVRVCDEAAQELKKYKPILKEKLKKSEEEK